MTNIILYWKWLLFFDRKILCDNLYFFIVKKFTQSSLSPKKEMKTKTLRRIWKYGEHCIALFLWCIRLFISIIYVFSVCYRQVTSQPANSKWDFPSQQVWASLIWCRWSRPQTVMLGWVQSLTGLLEGWNLRQVESKPLAVQGTGLKNTDWPRESIPCKSSLEKMSTFPT